MLKNLLFLISIIISAHSAAQPDTIIAANCFKHIINNGKISTSKFVVLQKTYDNNNQLIKEIYYHDSTHQPINIAYIFNENGFKISREEYNMKNDLMKVTRYSYNSSGKLDEEKIFQPDNNEISLKSKIKYRYRNDALSKKSVYNNTGKQIEKTVIKNKPQLTISKTFYAKGFENDQYKEKEIITENISELEKKITVMAKNLNGKKNILSKTDCYYNIETKLLEKETITNISDSSTLTIKYNYNTENKIFKKLYIDGNNKYLESYTYEYNKYFLDPGRKEMVTLPD